MRPIGLAVGQVQHVSAVSGEGEFEQRSGEARALIDDGKQGTR